MASLNGAMIVGVGNEYGKSLSNAEADRILGLTGGDETKVRNYFTTDPTYLAQQQTKLQNEAIKPAVESLQAQQPEITAKYGQARGQLEAERTPLEQRYDTLIQSIKNSGQKSVNDQTKITSNELGKRGITGSSTLAQQEIQDAVTPLVQQNTTNETNATLDKESAIRDLINQIANLTPQETADQRAITNAIASLQAGAGQTGISQGLSLYSTKLQDQLNQEQLKETQRLNDASISAAQNKSNNTSSVVEAGGRKYLLTYDTNGNVVNKTDLGSASTSSGTGSGLDITSLLSALGLGGSKSTTPTSPTYSIVNSNNPTSPTGSYNPSNPVTPLKFNLGLAK